MRILFDQGVPLPLRMHLTAHTVATAFERGWSVLENGALLAEAERDFDLFVTTDKNLRYQQNLANRRIAIAVLPTPQWPVLARQTDTIAAQIDALPLGGFTEIVID